MKCRAPQLLSWMMLVVALASPLTVFAAENDEDYEDEETDVNPVAPKGPQPIGFVRPFYNRIRSSLDLTPPKGPTDDVRVRYATFTNWVIGGAANYKGMGFALASGVKRPEETSKRRTNVTSIGLMLDIDRWSYEAYWNSLRGYNLEDAGDINPTVSASTSLEKRGDIRSDAIGITALFVRTPKDVWIGGRFTPEPIRPGAGASWISNWRVATTQIDASESLIPESSKSKFGDEANLKGFDIASAGAGMGFAWSYVGDALRVGFAMLGNGSYGHVNVHNTPHDDNQFTVSFGFRLGAAYAARAWEAGVFGIVEDESASIGKSEIVAKREVIQTYVKWLFY